MKEPFCEPVAKSSRRLLACSWNALWHWQSGTGGRGWNGCRGWLIKSRLPLLPQPRGVWHSVAEKQNCWRVAGVLPGHLQTLLTNRSNGAETWCLEVNLPSICPAGAMVISCSSVRQTYHKLPDCGTAAYVQADHDSQSIRQDTSRRQACHMMTIGCIRESVCDALHKELCYNKLAELKQPIECFLRFWLQTHQSAVTWGCLTWPLLQNIIIISL